MQSYWRCMYVCIYVSVCEEEGGVCVCVWWEAAGVIVALIAAVVVIAIVTAVVKIGSRTCCSLARRRRLYNSRGARQVDSSERNEVL